MIVIRYSKNICFKFDWPKDTDENWKHEIEFIIKSNESLADNKENENEQLMDESHKFVLATKIRLRSWNNNELKIIAPTWNDYQMVLILFQIFKIISNIFKSTKH